MPNALLRVLLIFRLLNFESVFFFCLCVFSVTVISFLIKIRLDKRKFRDQMATKDKNVVAERQRISSEIHDEIGSGLTALKLLIDVTMKNWKEIEEIKEINDLTNDISDKISNVIWQTNPQNSTMEALIFHISDQLHDLFQHSSIELQIQIPENIPTLVITHDFKRNLYLLIIELANNAIKHSKSTRCTLHFSFDIYQAVISFMDNGIGLADNISKKHGMGMSNLNARVKNLDGELRMYSAVGLTYEIRLPLKYGDEKMSFKNI